MASQEEVDRIAALGVSVGILRHGTDGKHGITDAVKKGIFEEYAAVLQHQGLLKTLKSLTTLPIAEPQDSVARLARTVCVGKAIFECSSRHLSEDEFLKLSALVMGMIDRNDERTGMSVWTQVERRLADGKSAP